MFRPGKSVSNRMNGAFGVLCLLSLSAVAAAAQTPVNTIGSDSDAGDTVVVQSMSVLDVLNGSGHLLLIAFFVTLLSTPIIRKFALRRGIVDHPTEARKIHREPIPYLGGVAVLLGCLVGIGVSWVFSPADLGFGGIPAAVVIGMLAIAITGLCDDIFGWDPRAKVAGQLVAAAGLVIVDVGTRMAEGFLSPICGPADTSLFTFMGEAFVLGDIYYYVGVGLIAIFILGACNAANFIDGLDGLLSGVTSIVVLGILIISLVLLPTYGERVPDAEIDQTSALVETPPDVGGQSDSLAPSTVFSPDRRQWTISEDQYIRAREEHRPVSRIMLCLIVLGATLGFLPWNFNPAAIFLGDCGSLTLGYLCAVLIIMLGDRGQTHFVVAGLIVFALPIMDTILAIVRRRLSGVSMTTADDLHIHHQAKRLTGSVRKAVFLLYGVTVCFAIVGIAMAVLHPLGFRARLIYGVALVLFGFISVIAFKAARMAEAKRRAAPAVPSAAS